MGKDFKPVYCRHLVIDDQLPLNLMENWELRVCALSVQLQLKVLFMLRE